MLAYRLREVSCGNAKDSGEEIAGASECARAAGCGTLKMTLVGDFCILAKDDGLLSLHSDKMRAAPPPEAVMQLLLSADANCLLWITGDAGLTLSGGPYPVALVLGVGEVKSDAFFGGMYGLVGNSLSLE